MYTCFVIIPNPAVSFSFERAMTFRTRVLYSSQYLRPHQRLSLLMRYRILFVYFRFWTNKKYVNSQLIVNKSLLNVNYSYLNC